jgi:hypothetical protein
MTRKTLTTTWLAQIVVVLALVTVGAASASSGFLGGNSCRDKNPLEGGFHQASASVSDGTLRACGDSCQEHAANSVVAPIKVGSLQPLKTGNSGYAARIAKGAIGEEEAARIIAELEKAHPGGVKVVWNSPDTGFKMPQNYAAHPPGGPTEIHFMGGPAETERGVFFEEVQHALDRHANYDWIDAAKMGGNEKLHAGTFERLSKNDLFKMTPEEREAFLKLVPDLAQGKLPPVP